MSALSIVLMLVIIIVAGAAAVAGTLWVLVRRPLPQTKGRLEVPGLHGPVEVIRDRWGVPHLYAGDDHDLFVAQGFVHAQDRMWQMEFQRRLAAGRLSEVIGEPTVELDRFFRVLGLQRAAEADVAALSDEARAAVDAYSAGVNAYLAAQKGRYGIEFTLLRFEPEPWRAVDCLSWLKVMAWNMGCNWASEIVRARLADALGPDLAADLEPAYPADSPAIVHGPGRAGQAPPPPNGWGTPALREAMARAVGLLSPLSPSGGGSRAVPPGAAAAASGPAAANSNQWVVSGTRTATGRPLLANDTHLLLQLPTSWHQVHLHGGNYHVAGASLPGMPGVAVGHNEDCAWGITIAWHDAQDLYVERLHPDDPRRYEYKGQWLEAEVRREEIGVKGRAEPVVEEVAVTHHGPIISRLVGEATPLALRWVALDPCDIVGAVLKLNRARNWDEFRAATANWAAPSLNFVYADVAGNIGFLQAGRVPVRAGDGLVPAPGWSGEYEWGRDLALDELPHALNPERGWLATANHLVVDEGYPFYLSSDLENPARARRIADLLDGAQGLTADDFARFQLDTYSAQSARLARHLSALEATDDRQRRALAYLREWDGKMEPGSVAATIGKVCEWVAIRRVFDPHLGSLADVYAGLGLTPLGENGPYADRSLVRLLDLLDGRGSEAWLEDPATGGTRTREAILGQALEEALELLTEKLGAELDQWRWGRMNKIEFAHPLGAVKPLNLLLNRGPFVMGGGADTLLRASGKAGLAFDGIQLGDALRFVADPGDWEACRMVVPGGQSGHAGSRHYADLIPLWLEGKWQPMPFARERVEQHAAARLVLTLAAETPG
ncbi:MAG: penicillin acylase family protein [Anaerolineae bacterium]|nr:penicillin acylase family protein [Anaerolineae bacterium]